MNLIISFSLLLPLERQRAMDRGQKSAQKVSTSVKAALQQAMMERDPARMTYLVRASLDQPDVERIWILDPRGLTRFSSQPSDDAESFAFSEPGCGDCHYQQPTIDTKADVLPWHGGHRGLLNVSLVRNQPECEECHGRADPLLGFVVVAMPLTELRSQLVGSWLRVALAALATFALLVGLLLAALRRSVVTPLGVLAQGVSEIRGGNLDHQVRIAGDDELGQLGQAFEAMRSELKQKRWQTKQIAILEERDRLARELHDDLAQALCYLNFQATTADECLQCGEVKRAEEIVREFKQIAKETYMNVRESIFDLRTARSADQGLLEALSDYLSEYRVHYMMDVALALDGGDLAGLSPDKRVQLLRIIQEALMNVRKHAPGSHACVSLTTDDGYLQAIVEDDGCGFDPACLSDPGFRHFGIQIMQERAESVGGSLQIDSRAGRGTRIVVRLPMATEE